VACWCLIPASPQQIPVYICACVCIAICCFRETRTFFVVYVYCMTLIGSCVGACSCVYAFIHAYACTYIASHLDKSRRSRGVIGIIEFWREAFLYWTPNKHAVQMFGGKHIYVGRQTRMLFRCFAANQLIKKNH
jgi:hypothetical protein